MIRRDTRRAGMVRLRRVGPALVWVAAMVTPFMLAPAALASAGTTTTDLVAHPNPVTVGQTQTATARISPRPDGGTVLFAANGITIFGCGAVPVSAATGAATCQTEFGSAGTDTLEAAYSGDLSFAASHSRSLLERVSPSLRLEHWLSDSAGARKVRLRCEPRSGGCHATVTLSAFEAHGRRQTRRATTILLGTTKAAIPAGQKRTLMLKLDRTGSALLARRGKLTAKLEVAVTEDQVRSVVATRQLTLTAPNPILAVTGAEVVRYAKQLMGVPYVYAGNGPTTFDCSGFTSYVFAHFGYHLARVARYQMEQGRPVTGPLELGDLILWDNGGHVGIYTGNQTFISATAHRGIWIYSFQIWSQTQTYTTARRILGRPTAGWPANATSAVVRNGGPAAATP